MGDSLMVPNKAAPSYAQHRFHHAPDAFGQEAGKEETLSDYTFFETDTVDSSSLLRDLCVPAKPSRSLNLHGECVTQPFSSSHEHKHSTGPSSSHGYARCLEPFKRSVVHSVECKRQQPTTLFFLRTKLCNPAQLPSSPAQLPNHIIRVRAVVVAMPRNKRQSATAQGKRKIATPRSLLATLPDPKPEAPAKKWELDPMDLAHIGAWTDHLQPPGEETKYPPCELVIDEPEKPAEGAK
ncbi:hypothetical protein ISF_00135 [Cordyceps fumosorosea ARSEF 2679]|uniref:Uncharacterized protein n=1 Tax=Cordyceps fumosorosea (strain ARSEF 2679) TaxID=1081104 RepID=A0A162LND4_CORFA|nr:hypothetical protein ISF_00135 [Cordyceps fumosorosea ARSEF 2679]OAA73234.1 hypothetical protein ISF_00135 [Cordyceps fumosorosea ARSEF 2679]